MSEFPRLRSGPVSGLRWSPTGLQESETGSAPTPWRNTPPSKDGGYSGKHSEDAGSDPSTSLPSQETFRASRTGGKVAVEKNVGTLEGLN